MGTERHHGRLLWYTRFLLLLFGVGAGGTASAEQQLTVGSVALKLGAADSAVVQQLSTHYKVQRIDGGWSIQPLDRDPTAPAIGVRTADGRIQTVSFLWGPGFTPRAEDVAEQLAQALPTGMQCGVRNIARSQEGGTVRTLEWLCGSYTVSFVTGVSPQGNTASISIAKQ
jgi:hypothetical protein